MIAGDRENLVLDNIKLVVHIAREFSKSPELAGELIEEGNIGLVEASQKYDESKGKFQSYAGTIIRNKMLAYLKQEPKNQVSFEAIINSDGLPLSDTLVDPMAINPERELIRAELIGSLNAGLDRLHPREKWIISRYFGLGDSEPMTLEEIGNYIGSSKQYVHQLVTETLDFMRNFIKKS